MDAARLDGTTSLMGASSRGHREGVRELCMRGADVDAARASDGLTPLIMASMGGHVGVIRELCAGVYGQLSVAGAVWQGSHEPRAHNKPP